MRINVYVGGSGKNLTSAFDSINPDFLVNGEIFGDSGAISVNFSSN